MTFIFHAVDGVGLGHLSRLLGIADSVRVLAPDIPLVFLTESTDARLLNEYSMPYYQIPRYPDSKTDQKWGGILQARLAAWQGIIREIVNAHEPRVVVQDTYLQHYLHQCAKLCNSKEVFVLRKHLNTAEYIRKNRHILTDFSLIAFPHEASEIEPINTTWFPQEKMMYCGPLLRHTYRDTCITDIQRIYGLKPEELTVVVSDGGGNTISDLEDNFIEIALQTLKSIEGDLPPLCIVVVSGPLNQRQVEWVDFTRGRLIHRSFEPNMLDLFAASDLVLARGGYNTVLELKEANVPAICVPARRYGESQEDRIQQAQAESEYILSADLSLISLRHMIFKAVRRSRWIKQSYSTDNIQENKIALARRLIEIGEN